MTLAEPLCRFRSLNMHVALGGTYLYLRNFCLRDVCLCLHLLLFLFLFVLKLPIVRNFSNGRLRIRRYLDKVEAELLCFCDRITCRHDAEIAPVGTDDAHLRSANTLIHANTFLFSLRSVLSESHLSKDYSTKCSTHASSAHRPLFASRAPFSAALNSDWYL